MKFTSVCLGLVSGIFIGGMLLPAMAQVTSDGTTSTVVNQSGNNFNILNGIEKGNNLFHSFGNFSVPNGGSATFDLVNTPNITTIFSRVTGGNVSNIDGLIQTLNSTNPVSLFLMNPAGIVFGKDASLNIGGSFVGTTANSIKFADGTEFSAVNPSSPPLLTMSVPIGLQMGQNPGAIISRSQAVDTEGNTVGLEVQPLNTLALIGGEVLLEGGSVTAPSGHIELAGLGGNASVSFSAQPSSFSFSYPVNQLYRDLRIQSATVSTNGDGGGILNLTGQNLFASQANILNETLGAVDGATIRIWVKDAIDLEQSNALIQSIGSGSANRVDLLAGSILLRRTLLSGNAFGDGATAAINLQADTIQLKEGGTLVSFPFGSGSSRNMTLTATGDIFITGSAAEAAGANVAAFGTSPAGSLIINAKNLLVNKGGGFLGTRGRGTGANLIVTAQESVRIENGGFTVATAGNANAGNITITAPSVVFDNRGGIGTSTSGAGNAGTIDIKADHLTVQNSSQITTQTTGEGNGGALNLSVGTLRVANGGQISSPVRGNGNGGTVSIVADRVELTAQPDQFGFSEFPTGIFTSAQPGTQGQGGNISVVSRSLSIADGGLISAGSAGKGNSGTIALSVGDLTILRGGQVVVNSRSQGNAGSLTVNADNVVVAGRDTAYNPRISAISTVADLSRISEQNVGAFSGLYANTSETSTGSGGSLSLTANQVRIQDEAILTTSSLGSGEAGNLSINARSLQLNNQGSLKAEATAGSNGSINVNADLLLLRQGSSITTNATQTASGGNISINVPVIVGLDNSDIIANALKGRGGNIDITTQGIFGLKFRDSLTPRTDPTNDITASSQFNVNGTVQINNIGVDPNSGLVELPANVTDPSQQIASGCATNQGSSFVATGRGGIPQNPNQEVRSDRTWSDIRDIYAYRKNPGITAQIPSSTEVLVQATGWRRNAQGKIELVADKSNTQVQPFLTCRAMPKS
jgi:filamentous hemagglutinin family protein